MSVLKPPKNATEAFIQTIIDNHIPFNFLSSESFRRFWSKYVPGTQIPTRQNAAGHCLDTMFEETLVSIKKEIANCEHISLGTDGWTGFHTSYWSITAQGLDANFEVCHFKLGCLPIFAAVHNASVISSKIKEVLKMCGIEEKRICAVVTDEGGAAPLIAERFPAANEIHCAAHLLNTALRNAFDEIIDNYPQVGLVLTACRDLASTYNRSTQFMEQITTNQLTVNSVTSIKQSVVTRWNSKLANIKSVKQSRDAIISYCVANPNSEHFADVVLRHANIFWNIIDVLIIILERFQEATIRVQGENEITADQIIKVYLALRMKLASPTLFHSLQNEMDTNIDELLVVSQEWAHCISRWLKRKFEPFHDAEMIAFALNPSNTMLDQTAQFQEWNELVTQSRELLRQTLVQEAETLSTYESSRSELPIPASEPNAQQDELFSIFPLAPQRTLATNTSNEFESFIDEGKLPNQTLSAWWRMNCLKYPLMSRLARQYLCFPASQSSSERDFSQLRLICTHLRSNLDPMKIFKLSIVRPAIRSFYNAQKSPKTRSIINIAADEQRNKKRETTRIAKLKRRYSEITPNPMVTNSHASLVPITIDDDDFVEENIIGDGERSSDEDFSEHEDDECAAHAEDLLMNGLAITKVPKQADFIRSTRSSKPICNIVQIAHGEHRYTALFRNLKRSPPSYQRLFGDNECLICNWKQAFDDDPLRYTFQATDEAKKLYTSGKQFLRHIAPLIEITEDMWE